MNRALLALVLFSVLVGAFAIAPREQAALEDLLLNFPALAHQSPPWTSNTSEACGVPGFYGVSCDPSQEYQVVGLEFIGSDLIGSLPESLGNLESLQRLVLRNISFEGQIPVSIGKLINLFEFELTTPPLSFYGNNITIIDEFQTLSKMKSLTMSVHSFGGYYGSQFDDMSLHTLRLTTFSSPATLRGSITQTLMNNKRLQHLQLRNTDLSNLYSHLPPNMHLISLDTSHSLGLSFRIPAWMTSLEVINFNSSGSHGFIEDVCTLPNLRYLNLRDTRTLQELQECFWDLTKLEFIDLSGTAVYAYISPRIGTMSNLTHLILPNNGVSGTIPPEIGQCSHLEEIVINDAIQLSGTLPESIAALKKLRVLQITSTQLTGTLPNNLSNWTSMTHLELSQARLGGTIPSSIARLTALRTLKLSSNYFEGRIPSLPSTTVYIDLSGNHLTGSIESAVTRELKELDLSDNFLGPFLEENLFLQSKLLNSLSLRRNSFTNCTLPHLPISDAKAVAFFDLSYNQFIGAIPESYRSIPSLNLEHNHLNESLNDFFSDSSVSVPWRIAHLWLAHNLFEEPLPPLSHLSNLKDLDLSYNGLYGDLHPLPPLLSKFVVSNNNFGTPLTESFLGSFTFSEKSSSSPGVRSPLSHLDLSYNRFRNPMKTSTRYFRRLLEAPSLNYLSLAYNDLSGLIDPVIAPSNTLLTLDLTNNTFVGPFPIKSSEDLRTVMISRNWFQGPFGRLSDFPSLIQLDISINVFQFDTSLFFGASQLTTLNASHNKIFGSLGFRDMPSLEVIDLSYNDLNLEPDFASIGRQFSNRRFQALYMTKNLDIPRMQGLNRSSTGITRTTTSFKVSNIVCYSLTFNNDTAANFIYDMDLFDYSQCDCNATHFGLPPSKCFPCPSSQSSSCGGTELVSTINTFVFPYTEHATPLSVLETESCIYMPIQAITKTSKCRPLTISAAMLQRPNVSVDNVLQSQCKEGAEGRLCSRCQCNISGACYYDAQTFCRRCSHVFTPAESVVLLISALLLIIAVTTGVMFLILRSKRSNATSHWIELPLLKRAFYRLLHLVSLGNVSILIGFLQILSEFTHWDSQMIGGVLNAINGSLEGIGLLCVFPFLSHPIAMLLCRLSIPVIAVMIIGVSTFIADLIARKMERKVAHFLPDDMASESDNDGNWAINSTATDLKSSIAYPAMALFTSTSLSVIKFFYFGTAIAAHEYIFPSSQPYTHTKYVQNQPWMKYDDALSLIAASVPAMIIFDFVLPFSFIVLCWKVRDTYDSVGVQVYFGSMFESFSRRCFWWEIVNILRKLTIALVLQGLPSNSAIQSALVLSVVSGTMVVQVSLSPWKRGIENIFDTISSVLLTASLHISRAPTLMHNSAAGYYMVVLNSLFVAANLLVIAHETCTERTIYQQRHDHLHDESYQPLVQAESNDETDTD